MNDPKIKAALKWLKLYQHLLTRQEYKTLRGQALAGDAEGSIKGLKRIIARKK